MLVNIPATFIDDVKEIIPGVVIPHHRGEMDPIEINLRYLNEEQFKLMEKALAANPAGVGVRRQISGWQNALKDPANSKPGVLTAWEAALIDYFVDNASRGWIYEMSDEGAAPSPWLLTDVTYYKSYGSGDDYVPAHVIMRMMKLTDRGHKTESVYFEAENVKGLSVVEFLIS